ncbi:MAG: SsrA-binding protein SmpB [Angelakisella sp.]
MGKDSIKQISYNRQARHNFFVEESLEAGIELFGTEVKSLRCGGLNLRDAWCDFREGELFVKQMHINPYEQGNIFNRDPLRERKLLLHRRELTRLFSLVKQQGVTLIPLQVYFKGSRVKLEIGVCRGKKLYDKRDDAAQKDAKRDIDRALKARNKV